MAFPLFLCHCTKYMGSWQTILCDADVEVIEIIPDIRSIRELFSWVVRSLWPPWGVLWWCWADGCILTSAHRHWWVVKLSLLGCTQIAPHPTACTQLPPISPLVYWEECHHSWRKSATIINQNAASYQKNFFLILTQHLRWWWQPNTMILYICPIH